MSTGAASRRRLFVNVILSVLLSMQMGIGSDDQQIIFSLIDVPSIVCPGGPGVATIDIPNETMKAGSHQPQIPTMFRSTLGAVTVSFMLNDSSVPPLVVIPNTTIELDAHARRLTNIRVVAQSATLAADTRQADPESERETCEPFFLLDGRSPVELPETWGEAREAFRDMCVEDGFSQTGCSDAEKKIFQGHTERPLDELMNADAALCQRLMEHAAAAQGSQIDSESVGVDPSAVPLVATVMNTISGAPLSAQPRRMKGFGRGFTTSGHTTADSFRSRAGGHAGMYGYGTSAMQRNYPLGYGTTSYGYSGVGAYRPSLHRPVYMVFPPSYHGHGHYSRYSTYCADGSCHGYDPTCHTPGPHGCVQSFVPGETLNRDDLMEYGFIAADFKFPLKLTIFNVVGPDFSPEKICPPPGWMPTDGGSTWRPPDADLYFAIATAEASEQAGGSDHGASLLLLGVIAFWCDIACRQGATPGTGSKLDSGHPRFLLRLVTAFNYISAAVQMFCEIGDASYFACNFIVGCVGTCLLAGDELFVYPFLLLHAACCTTGGAEWGFAFCYCCLISAVFGLYDTTMTLFNMHTLVPCNDSMYCYTPALVLTSCIVHFFGLLALKYFMQLRGSPAAAYGLVSVATPPPGVDDTEVHGPSGPIKQGIRVKTQYTVEEGGDGRWYSGVVQYVTPGTSQASTVSIRYDDGDVSVVEAQYVYYA